MWVFIVFCAANFGRLLKAPKCARLDSTNAVTAILVTISEIFDDSLNYLVENQKNEDLEVVIRPIN